MAANYYAPAPTSSNKHQNKRSNGFFCCGICRCCLTCCCGIFQYCIACILNLVCQILCTILIIAAVIIFILWLLFRPNNLQFHAAQASLPDFTLHGNTLRYDLEINVSARNPNPRLEIIYQRIEAVAYYEHFKFAAATLPTFEQETKTTDAISAAFKGRNESIALGDEARANYEEERISGWFNINVGVQLKVKLKLWVITSPFSLKPAFICYLSVPLKSTGKPYQGRDCEFDWRGLYLPGISNS